MHELAVKQFEAADLQARNQPRQRYLRCIAFAAEHAFAKKGAAKRYAIETADALAFQPAFNTVRMPPLEKRKPCQFDRLVDPAFRPVRSCICTGAQNKSDESRVGQEGVRCDRYR